ncbi:MFS transporter [Nocardioides daphniae]|uniref:Tetracycline efflux MFS transporter Tet(V) n=1 Tax=Nocardioides daphniae TaxID=402297 RepID=A0ABQ1Q2B3_9ACTN|nr:MFS transporter [Nocardioides daphniae]GGD10102.1 tetracycline efflux MFS transporter Tet(V) [Nocardioides daphniae]
MSDPIIDNLLDTVGDQEVGRAVPRALTPFKVPAYRKLAAALVFSSFASGVWLVALVWEVFRLGGGAAQLSLVSTMAAVGVIIPALLAGVVADRVPQKRILLAVAGVELAGMTVAAVAAYADVSTVGLLAGIAFVTGMAMSFYYPAYSALLPAIVPAEDLMAVNGFEGMVRPTVAQAIGPAAAGAVIGVAAPSLAFAVAAGAMVLALLALTTVPLTPVRRTLDEAHARHPVRSAFTDMGEGMRYMVRTPWLLATLVFACLSVLALMGPLEVLVPVFIKSTLEGDASHHSWVLGAFGIGGAIGSLAMASIRMPRRYLTVMMACWGFGSLPFILIAEATEIWMIVLATFVVGIFFAAPTVIWGTLLQRRVPPELLGRVSSLDFFVSISLMPVSMALVGPLSDLIGVRETFWISALAPALMCVVFWLWARMPADEVAHPLD